MRLELIKDEVCPTCKSSTVQESCYSKHCNGEGFEKRKFACGCVLSWCPNFSKLVTDVKCPKDPEMLKRTKRRQEKARKLLDCIARLGIEPYLEMRLYDAMGRDWDGCREIVGEHQLNRRVETGLDEG